MIGKFNLRSIEDRVKGTEERIDDLDNKIEKMTQAVIDIQSNVKDLQIVVKDLQKSVVIKNVEFHVWTSLRSGQRSQSELRKYLASVDLGHGISNIWQVLS